MTCFELSKSQREILDRICTARCNNRGGVGCWRRDKDWRPDAQLECPALQGYILVELFRMIGVKAWWT